MAHFAPRPGPRWLHQMLAWQRRWSRFYNAARRVPWLYVLPAALYLSLALRVPHGPARDLAPAPDALEYAFITDDLIHARPPLAELGAAQYPYRYPLVFPLLATVPAKLTEWITPRDTPGGYLTRIYWISIAFGLASVLLMAHWAAGLTGSRAAGLLAALLLSTHPSFLRWSGLFMSEPCYLTLWLALMLALRPWLQPAAPVRAPGWFTTPVRAALAGTLAAWMTIGKAPFGYWALAGAVLIFLTARRRHQWGPLVAYTVAGLIFAMLEAAYRVWAFGGVLRNGYKYWHPELYAHGDAVSAYYLFHNYRGAGAGNFIYYTKLITGWAVDFFSPQLAMLIVCGGLALLALAYFGRVPSPTLPRVTTSLLIGWFLAGFTFCLLYFYQSERFLLLWIPVLDVLAAWALVQWPRFEERARSGLLRLWVARIATLMFACALLGRQFDVIAVNPPTPANQPAQPRLPLLPGMLAHVPAGAALFTDYNLLLVQALRPSPGLTGVFTPEESAGRFFNGHASQILQYQIQPKRRFASDGLLPGSGPIIPLFNADAAGSTLTLPTASGTTTTSLPAALREMRNPVYLLHAHPAALPGVDRFWRDRVLPQLQAAGRLETVAWAGDLHLYRWTPFLRN